MTRVAFVEGYYDTFAGAQQSLMCLLENISTVHPILVTPRYGRINEIAEERDIDTTVIPCPARLDKFEGRLLNGSILDYMSRGLSYAHYQVSVATYLREASIDVLYCNNPRSLLFFGPAAKLLRIPVIWYVRNDAKGGYTGPQMLDKVTTRIADHLICISDGVRDRFENHRVNERKFTTINTGVDIEMFDSERDYRDIDELPEGATVIVQAAMLHPRKGQNLLIEAVGQVEEVIGDYRVVFAGNVPEGQKSFKENMQARAEELGIADNVVFLGWCDDMPALLSRSDIFVLPSYNEGLPRSILEALAMRVPVVATPAGGTEEVARDGKTGYIVPMEDSSALGHAIQKLCMDPQLRADMGTAGRELVVEEYSVQSYVEEFEAFFESTFGQSYS